MRRPFRSSTGFGWVSAEEAAQADRFLADLTGRTGPRTARESVQDARGLPTADENAYRPLMHESVDPDPADLFFAELTGEPANRDRSSASGRARRSAGTAPAVSPAFVSIGAAGPDDRQRAGRRLDRPGEDSEQSPTTTFNLPVGQGLVLTATGTPLPVGTPAYTWVTADRTVATIAPLGTSQTHPSQARVQGLRPGTTRVTVTYRAGAGRVATSSASLTVQAPAAVLRIAKPAADSLWPVLLEPEDPGFLTRGLNQGGALWTSATGSGNLTLTHGDPANGTGDRTGTGRLRPGERGLVVQGQVSVAATGVQVRVMRGLVPLPLRTHPSVTGTSTAVSATLAAAVTGASTRDFEATIFIDDPASRFGEVTVRADASGLPANASATATVLLAGVQIALVNDRMANIDGSVAGPVLTEANERNVIDFLVSPQPDLPRISAQTRARRMIVYEIDHRRRPHGTTTIAAPEMPMWMTELHLVGVDSAALLALLRRRAAAPGGRRDLRVEAGFRLETSWDGPNSGSATRPYRYTKTWLGSTAASIALDTAGTAIDGLQISGEVRNALAPAPTAPAFPVSTRRTAKVFLGSVTRRWGRQSAKPLLPTTLIEHQPLLVGAANREIMRGGNGTLALVSLRIDGVDVDPGRIPDAAGTAAPPTGTALAMLPGFRIKGVNLPQADRRAMTDAIVAEHVAAHRADAWVAALALAQWQATVHLLISHESVGGAQFENRGTGRRQFGGRRFGHEQDMPMFGAPAGYGLGQIDNPPVTDDAAWSFTDNLRMVLDILIGSKARGAHGAMSAHFATPMSRADQAAFRRETVRRYNGHTEMEWSGTAWRINPTVPQRDSAGNPNDRLGYCNAVLGTTIQYFTGTGAAATFPWPIAFPATQHGPGL